MKLSLRNIRILIFAGSFAILFAVIFFAFNPLMKSNDKMEKENSKLSKRHQELLQIEAKQDEYKSETTKMQKEISGYTLKFPADVKAEDCFLMGMNMENAVGMSVNDIALTEKEYVYSVEKIDNTEGQTDEGTLSEQNNESTKQAVDEIEGVAESADLTGAPAGIEGDMALYRTLNTLTFASSYNSLKSAIAYLTTQTGRMTIDNINVAYDTTTGNLSGTIGVNMYSMTNTGSAYQKPSVDGIALGKENIFGTIEIPAETQE